MLQHDLLSYDVIWQYNTIAVFSPYVLVQNGIQHLASPLNGHIPYGTCGRGYGIRNTIVTNVWVSRRQP